MNVKTIEAAAAAALILGLHTGAALAQQAPPEEPPATAEAEGGPETIPLIELIEGVAERSGRNFIVDPRVRAEVTLIGQDPADVDYDGLLAILQVHGYAAIATGDYVRIVPDAFVRSQAIPVASGESDARDLEYVSKVIEVRGGPAPQLVPLLRPLMPMQAHLAADVCRNALIAVDTAANIARIEALVAALDTGETYEPPSCEAFSRLPAPGPRGGERGPRRGDAEG
ncbi:MAG TPA: secretin N-terminal domain-containing protein [Gammaproteobacteria bacterium]